MPQADQSAIPPAVQQRLDYLEQFARQQEQRERAQLARQVDNALDQFLSDPANRYAENVAAEMAPLIKQRQDTNRAANKEEPYLDTLKWAYQRAVWANDEVRPLLLNEQMEAKTKEAQQAAQKARQATRSITGSPTPGVAPGESAETVRDALMGAYAAHRV